MTEKEGQYPFDIPYYLLSEIQLGSAWGGKVNAKGLSVEMSVDWVRYYQKWKNKSSNKFASEIMSKNYFNFINNRLFKLIKTQNIFHLDDKKLGLGEKYKYP